MTWRLEKLFPFIVMSLIAAGALWNLWDIATTTSQADLWAMAKFYFEMAGTLALVSAPLVTYAVRRERRPG